MTNYLYKIFKYCYKMNDYSLINYITPPNIREIYLQNKILYINKSNKSNKLNNQTGGELVNPEILKNIDIIQTIYHGSLQNKAFIIPDNIYLILPLCCGFYNYAIHAYTEFFTNQYDEKGNNIPYEKVNEYIKTIVNNSENIIKIGYNNYIILRPSNEYCDIYLQIHYDTTIGTMPIGIFDSYRYRFKIKKYSFDENEYNLNDTNEELCNFIDDEKKINIYNGLLYMEKIRIKEWKIDDIENNQKEFSLFELKDKTYLLCHYITHYISKYISTYITVLKNNEEIFFKILNTSQQNIYKKIYDKQINNISRMNYLLIIYNFFKTYLQTNENIIINKFCADILKITRDNITKIIDEEFFKIQKINISDDNVGYLNFLVTIKNIFFKHINKESINDLILDQESTFLDKLCLISKINYIQTINFETNKEIYLIFNLVNIYFKLAVISNKDCIELECYKYIANNNLKFILSNVLNYLSLRQKKIYPTDIDKQKLFVFNVSCQGFSSDNICENNKCLRKLGINTSGIKYTEIFNQSSFLKIIEVIKLLNLPSYNYINIVGEESNINTMNSILESTQLFVDSQGNNYTKSACRLMIWYFKQEYTKIYNHLIQNLFNDPESLKESTNAIITFLNLAITLLYNKSFSQDQKYAVRHIMGDLILIT